MDSPALVQKANAWIEACRLRLHLPHFSPGEAVAFAREWESIAAELEEQPYLIRHEPLQKGKQVFKQLVPFILKRMDYLMDHDPDFFYGLERFPLQEKEYNEQRNWLENWLKKMG